MFTVFLEVEAKGTPLGWLTLELYDELFPVTVDSFNKLCSAEPVRLPDGSFASYRGTSFFRIVPGFVIQGGDVLDSGGVSSLAWNGEPHIEETFAVSDVKGNQREVNSVLAESFTRQRIGLLSHDRRGLLCTAAAGGDFSKVNSQFYITLGPCPWQDGRDLVFGSVINGLQILAYLESFGSSTGAVSTLAHISNCGGLASVRHGLQQRPGGGISKTIPLREIVRRYAGDEDRKRIDFTGFPTGAASTSDESSPSAASAKLFSRPPPPSKSGLPTMSSLPAMNSQSKVIALPTVTALTGVGAVPAMTAVPARNAVAAMTAVPARNAVGAMTAVPAMGTAPIPKPPLTPSPNSRSRRRCRGSLKR